MPTAEIEEAEVETIISAARLSLAGDLMRYERSCDPNICEGCIDCFDAVLDAEI